MLVPLLVVAACGVPASDTGWTATFDERPVDFTSTGRYPHFILEPGRGDPSGGRA